MDNSLQTFSNAFYLTTIVTVFKNESLRMVSLRNQSTIKTDWYSYMIWTSADPVHWRQYEPQHDFIIKWKHFPRYWPFMRGIHRATMDSLTKASDAELGCFLWSAPEQGLNKQSRHRLLETPSCSLWRHSNAKLWWVKQLRAIFRNSVNWI